MNQDNILWSIESLVIPSYNIISSSDLEYNITKGDNVIMEGANIGRGVDYDINRVSTRNATKSEIGPYKTAFLREIINSNNMGKATGTKSELVSTILNFHEKKTR